MGRPVACWHLAARPLLGSVGAARRGPRSSAFARWQDHLICGSEVMGKASIIRIKEEPEDDLDIALEEVYQSFTLKERHKEAEIIAGYSIAYHESSGCHCHACRVRRCAKIVLELGIKLLSPGAMEF